MAPRRKCPVCGSKQWHKEPASGLITCSEGHVLQNYRNETTEVTELGPHAVRKRTLKSGKKKEKRNKADPKLYHGERARFHYFQCLQLILRMQVTALTRLWNLPPDFETVCREIWALHLSLLPSPPVPEPLLHLQDMLGPSRASRTQQKDSGAANEGEDERSDDASSRQSDSGGSSSSEGSSSDSGSGSDSGSDTDSGSEGEERDEELDELMRENSETPSEDDDHEDEGERQKRRASVPAAKKRRNFGQFDAPASTVSVLVVACWTLRLPVMYLDFVRLLEGYDLPYLDSLRLLPENMTRHLAKHTAQALSPHHAPTTLALHRLASRLARLLYTSYDIYTPEMNAAPILWKAVRSLQGTPVLYVLAKKLAHRVSVPLTLHRTLAPALARSKARDPLAHKQDSAVPEVALAAAVIVVVKLVYGLDGKSRRPREKADPACALPTLPELVQAIRAAEAADVQRAPVSAMGTATSALDMDDAMMDAYLEFCEKALLPREDRMPPRNATTDHFPLHGESESIASKPVEGEDIPPYTPFKTVNSVDADGEELRPGEQYTICNTQDILGTLPDDLDLIISATARWAGVEPVYVSGVVERFERRTARWWDVLRRKERDEAAAEQRRGS